MTAVDALRLLLRLGHASAALVWLGGGVYFAIGIVPILRTGEPVQRSIALAAQQRFGDWSRDATIVLLGTGIILMFDRLSSGVGVLTYAAILAVKVGSTALAFLLVTERYRWRIRERRPGISTTRVVLMLGWTAFLLGVGLAAYNGRGIA